MQVGMHAPTRQYIHATVALATQPQMQDVRVHGETLDGINIQKLLYGSNLERGDTGIGRNRDCCEARVCLNIGRKHAKFMESPQHDCAQNDSLGYGIKNSKKPEKIKRNLTKNIAKIAILGREISTRNTSKTHPRKTVKIDNGQEYGMGYEREKCEDFKEIEQNITETTTRQPDCRNVNTPARHNPGYTQTIWDRTSLLIVRQRVEKEENGGKTHEFQATRIKCIDKHIIKRYNIARKHYNESQTSNTAEPKTHRKRNTPTPIYKLYFRNHSHPHAQTNQYKRQQEVSDGTSDGAAVANDLHHVQGGAPDGSPICTASCEGAEGTLTEATITQKEEVVLETDPTTQPVKTTTQPIRINGNQSETCSRTTNNPHIHMKGIENNMNIDLLRSDGSAAAPGRAETNERPTPRPPQRYKTASQKSTERSKKRGLRGEEAKERRSIQRTIKRRMARNIHRKSIQEGDTDAPREQKERAMAQKPRDTQKIKQNQTQWIATLNIRGTNKQGTRAMDEREPSSSNYF